jgi:hypothetical protein
MAVTSCGGRPRLQRRDRNGFAPFSLFFPARNERPEHLEAEPILAENRPVSIVLMRLGRLLAWVTRDILRIR